MSFATAECRRRPDNSYAGGRLLRLTGRLGPNADGGASNEYCSYCYQSGSFINPAMTVDEMRALIIEKLGEKGYPRFIARLFTIGLGRLKRWRNRG